MGGIKELGRRAVNVGVGLAVVFGASPAAASEAPQSSNENSSIPCIPGSFFPENPILGEFVGAPVRIPNNLREIQVRSLNGFPGSEYFYPIYDQNRADAAHNWAGIGPHYGVAFQNLDGIYAADLISWGNVGELIIRGNQGGRVAISYEHEQDNQWQGTWYTDSSGQRVFNPNVDMAYFISGLLQGQPVRVADADSGRQMHYADGSPIIFYPKPDGTLGFDIPKACGDARVQFVLPIASWQQVIIRRGPNDHPEWQVANPLPAAGVIKPGVPGAY